MNKLNEYSTDELNAEVERRARASSPKLIGRLPKGAFRDLLTDERSETFESAQSKTRFTADVLGKVTVTLFESKGDGDRGGFVLRILVEGEGGEPFLPHVVTLPNGIEVHVAGEHEAYAAAHGIVSCLRANRECE